MPEKPTYEELEAKILDLQDKRAEVEAATAELRTNEEWYLSLFVSNPHPMWIFDLDSLAFLDVNNAAVSHYGYSRNEFLSMTIKDIRPPDDVPELMENIRSVTNGLDNAGTWRHITKEGSVVQVEITSHVIQYEGRRAEMVLAYDITERKRAERERELLQSQLMQAHKMESVGRLAGGIAHDFNNMLSIIIGYAEMALEKLRPEDPLRQDIERIHEAGNRSADITRQLLAFARKQTISPKVLDLNKRVEDLLKMLERLLGEDIDLAWLPAADVWRVKMDPAQMDQILANLCVNARDAMNGVGKLTIETGNKVFDEEYCADHAGFKEGRFAFLSVGDTGRGIAPEVMENIFEPFFTTKDFHQGTGLGLATVYGIIKQNDGFINVYSEPEKGTVFCIYLPHHDGDPLKNDREEAHELLMGQGELVLLVEDDKSLLDLSQRLLQALGYSVLPASTPSEAIEKARACEGDIELLITDVVMPEMNGMQLSNQLMKWLPDLKVLYVSGYTANVIAHRGILNEGVQFLSKPFSKAEIARRVRETLDIDRKR